MRPEIDVDLYGAGVLPDSTGLYSQIRDAGPVVWRRPRYSTLREFIANPAYGGTYPTGAAASRQVMTRAAPRRASWSGSPREGWRA